MEKYQKFPIQLIIKFSQMRLNSKLKNNLSVVSFLKVNHGDEVANKSYLK